MTKHQPVLHSVPGTKKLRRTVLIGRDTLLPLGMVLGILLGVIGFYSWLDARFDGLAENNNDRFTEISSALHSMDDRLHVLEIKQHHRWDSLDMKEWMLELKRLNPDLNVPTVPLADTGSEIGLRADR
ncbi:MAG TPA: hypothetical protein VMF30_02655 [Pirellulales bacterium]|nr:hypothetical protein [Pirellulales bacterium]